MRTTQGTFAARGGLGSPEVVDLTGALNFLWPRGMRPKILRWSKRLSRKRRADDVWEECIEEGRYGATTHDYTLQTGRPAEASRTRKDDANRSSRTPS